MKTIINLFFTFCQIIKFTISQEPQCITDLLHPKFRDFSSDSNPTIYETNQEISNFNLSLGITVSGIIKSYGGTEFTIDLWQHESQIILLKLQHVGQGEFSTSYQSTKYPFDWVRGGFFKVEEFFRPKSLFYIVFFSPKESVDILIRVYKNTELEEKGRYRLNNNHPKLVGSKCFKGGTSLNKVDRMKLNGNVVFIRIADIDKMTRNWLKAPDKNGLGGAGLYDEIDKNFKRKQYYYDK